MNFLQRSLAALACCLLAAQAGANTSGTYVMQGGAYSIDVQFDAAGLTVVEPNKTSLYTQTSPGVYEFTNPTNGIHYGIRVIDDSTIEAFKPGSGQPGTILKLRSAPTFDDSNPAYEKYSAIAEKYAELSTTDADNVHVWAACAAAALAWAQMPESDAMEYSRQAAAMLQSIMTAPGGTPCADAIPAGAW